MLATPCSAPFLGTAIGFALSRGPVEILAVFLALGLGMASPYLAVALFPGLATRLPRPGNWMIWLERVLALVLGAHWPLSGHAFVVILVGIRIVTTGWPMLLGREVQPKPVVRQKLKAGFGDEIVMLEAEAANP